MNPEKSHRHSSKQKRQFAGCVELIPLPPVCIEFIDSHRLRGFPMAHLTDLVLEENPEHHGKKTLPPEQLVLQYRRSKVILKGWRLELLAGPLIAGRVARVHAEKHLGPLMIEEAWVSEIQVVPIGNPGPPATAVKIPITKL
jgi:hypothetical protein